MSKKKKYKIIYADPPWFYNPRKNKNTRFRGGANGHYKLMKVQEICDLKVQNICEDNAVLFLWVLFTKLKQGIMVGESWGFELKTLGFSWTKINRVNKKPFFGVGYYTKSNCEVCLLFTKGKVMKPVSNCVSSCVIAERREHSRKPDEVRKGIEQLYGDVPRIELFARKKVEGWDCLGMEIDGFNMRNL